AEPQERLERQPGLIGHGLPENLTSGLLWPSAAVMQPDALGHHQSLQGDQQLLLEPLGLVGILAAVGRDAETLVVDRQVDPVLTARLAHLNVAGQAAAQLAQSSFIAAHATSLGADPAAKPQAGPAELHQFHSQFAVMTCRASSFHRKA